MNKLNNKVAYLPLETVEREYWGRCLLASHLLKHGIKVYIFADHIFDKYGYPEAGYYIGKNLLKGWGSAFSGVHKKRASKDGITFFYLEEEFLPREGIDPYLTQIMDRFGSIAALNQTLRAELGDVFCSPVVGFETALASLPEKPYSSLTGSPNFESCKPKYTSLYGELSNLQADKEFILFISGVAASNPVGLSEYAPATMVANGPSGLRLYTRTVANAMRFLEAVHKVVISMPQNNFIFRPHPVEDEGFYVSYFKDCKNVRVSKAGPIQDTLCLATGVIHSGCTSALQSKVMEKPTVCYVADESYFSDLPFRLFCSEPIVRNEIELLAMVKRLFDRDFPSEDRRAVQYLCPTNPFATVLELLKESSDSEGALAREGYHTKRVYVTLLITCGEFLSRLAFRWFGRKSSYWNQELFEQIPTSIGKTCEMLGNKAPRVVRLSNKCYLFEPLS